MRKTLWALALLPMLTPCAHGAHLRLERLIAHQAVLMPPASALRLPPRISFLSPEHAALSPSDQAEHVISQFQQNSALLPYLIGSPNDGRNTVRPASVPGISAVLNRQVLRGPEIDAAMWFDGRSADDPDKLWDELVSHGMRDYLTLQPANPTGDLVKDQRDEVLRGLLRHARADPRLLMFLGAQIEHSCFPTLFNDPQWFAQVGEIIHHSAQANGYQVPSGHVDVIARSLINDNTNLLVSLLANVEHIVLLNFREIFRRQKLEFIQTSHALLMTRQAQYLLRQLMPDFYRDISFQATLKPGIDGEAGAGYDAKTQKHLLTIFYRDLLADTRNSKDLISLSHEYTHGITKELIADWQLLACRYYADPYSFVVIPILEGVALLTELITASILASGTTAEASADFKTEIETRMRFLSTAHADYKAGAYLEGLRFMQALYNVGYGGVKGMKGVAKFLQDVDCKTLLSLLRSDSKYKAALKLTTESGQVAYLQTLLR